MIDDRYEVLELLSRGDTADVGRVRHRVLGRKFALKALRDEVSRDVEYIERLLREARVLGAMNHPNVVSITDCGRLITGEPYLVMEYVEGISLERLIDQGPLELGLALEIASGVCDALEAAHQLGVIHRDLKPTNICVVRRGGRSTVKVLDFGLARVVGQRRLTRPDTAQGTPEYMSPEQATGSDVDARSDIYALGVILYEALCGRLPFAGDSYVTLAHQHMYAPVPEFGRWVSAGSGALRVEAVVRRCLEKDRAQRFGSAAELRQALEPLRVPDKTLRLQRSFMPPRERVFRFREEPYMGRRAARRTKARLRSTKLVRWALVGCCLGSLLLALVYWIGGGHIG